MDIVRGTDRKKHANDGFVRASVQGPVESSACGRNAAVGVDERRTDLEARSRTRVHFVLL